MTTATGERGFRSSSAARGFALRSAARGFTLIELMLALGLLALLLVILMGCFRAVSHSKLNAERALVAEQQGRAIMFLLSKELRGTVVTPFSPSHVLLIGSGQRMGGLPVDQLVFNTLDVGHRRSLNGFGAEEMVTYAPRPNPRHRKWYMLMRSQQSALLPQSTVGMPVAPPTIIADNVISLHLRFFDGVQWLESWNSQTTPNGQGLPMAVAIDLIIASPSGAPLSFSSEVLLPMAMLQR